MTDMLYEKQGSYLQGVKETKESIAKAMLALGKLTISEIAQASKLTESEVLALKNT